MVAEFSPSGGCIPGAAASLRGGMAAEDCNTQIRIRIVFTEALHFLLPRRWRGKAVDRVLRCRASIKNIIESMGVPHTEIGEILADGRPVGFDHIAEDRGRVSVQAVSAPLDVTRPTLLRPEPYDRLRFVVDENVGKLALLLRILGQDTAYAPGWTDRRIVQQARRERRVLLSKDVELLKCREILFGRLVRKVLPDEQLREIVSFFGIRGPYRLFSRCLRCNRELEPVAKADILEALEPKTKKYYHHFKRCPACRRIYWQGSHHSEMIRRLQRAGIDVSGCACPDSEACRSD